MANSRGGCSTRNEANDAAQIDELLAPGFIGHGLPPELGEGPAVMQAGAHARRIGRLPVQDR
jgi:hypothetical protein